MYNTTHAPAEVPIEQHLEATHTPAPPARILFCCMRAPAAGGETPLASFTELYDALPAAVLDAFRDDAVVYERRLIDRRSRLYRSLPQRVTDSLALSWQEVSGCDELSRARACFEGEGYEVTPLGRSGLVTRCSQPVIDQHPLTGRWRWQLSDQITRRLPLFTRLGRRLLRQRLGMEFYLASGRRPAQRVFDQVHDCIAALKFSFRWQPGDLLVLDNAQMSHGRNPFQGERLVLTAFG